MDQNRIRPIENSKKTIAAIVQDRIREAILDHLLPGGTRIDQNRLAADLNVSLVPVREALKGLEAEGFVQIIPRRGAFVTEASLDDLEDLYFARGLLEGQVAYHAAEKLTDEDLKQIAQLHQEMGIALEKHDLTRFMQLNHRFHFIIYTAAGSKHMLNIISNLWDLAERYRYRYVFMRDQGQVIQQEHHVILEACHARSPKALRDAIVYHMNQTLHGVRSQIEAEGLKRESHGN